jgi:hypothetical protein
MTEDKMPKKCPYTIDEEKLREPERIREQIPALQAAGFSAAASALEVLMQSKASNDLLEKIAIESIRGVCSGKKLGADGYFPYKVFPRPARGIEAKPHKGKSSSSNGGCINDDTPMKLKRDFEEIGTIVFQNAEEDGSRINWQVVAPYRYWFGDRFQRICKRLGIERDWPETADEQAASLEALQAEHKKETYVRSSPLHLKVLGNIPRHEIAVWVHRDLAAKQIPRIIRTLLA